MSLLVTLEMLYAYDRWANALMLDACEALTPEQWDRPLGGSWGSVHGLLTHMLAAQILWLARWRGSSPTTLRQPEEFPTLADLRRAWREAEADLRGFVASCSEEALAGDLSYFSTQGQPYRFPLGHLMLHLANHGTHHRGELAAMLAALDVPHPEDDLLFYLRQQR